MLWEMLQTLLLVLLVSGVSASAWYFRSASRREAAYSVARVLRGERYASEMPYGLPLDDFIRDAEIQAGVRLTWHARQLLILPVVESYERGEDVSLAQIDESIRDIVKTIAKDPSPDDGPGRSRSSRSVIRGFHRRFCNIPPFCSRRDEERSS